MKAIALILIVAVMLTGYYFYHARTSSQELASPISSISVAIPQTLTIPVLGIEAKVEEVGLTPTKAMDVPKDPDNVAWYGLGYIPGQPGSAVISGHLDKADGTPAVFARLQDLRKGDKIIVTDYGKQEHKFEVTDYKTYRYNQVPLPQIFNSAGTATLNLITCQGTWNEKEQNYSDRLVVYAKGVK